QTDEAPERSGDQMQLVLDDEIGWSQRSATLDLHAFELPVATPRVAVLGVVVRREVPVSRASSTDRAEQARGGADPAPQREPVAPPDPVGLLEARCAHSIA